ncbi:MAG: sulfite exporter TauE/SafE family protein [Gammaproteobacteria bacterium]|nr:sulfite exporter TauE/SafE family protein [Gammaproteobacteria bacterium]
MDFAIAGITASPLALLAWGLLIGLIFSMVGAAGGILASVGLISIFHVTDPNLVKPMAQFLTLLTPLIAVPHYYKKGQLVISLVILLGLGGIVGALIGSTLSATYLDDLSSFKPVFAIMTILIALQLIWELLPRERKATRADDASEMFQSMAAEGGDLHTIGVKHGRMSWRYIPFDFAGSQFGYAPWKPFVAGMLFAIISSALGVGGGFLLVPFMAQMLRLPMYIIAGTAAFTIIITSAVSVANYMQLGVTLDWPLLGILLVGTAVGAFLGPRLGILLPDRSLRGLLAVILFLIGLRYLGVF